MSRNVLEGINCRLQRAIYPTLPDTTLGVTVIMPGEDKFFLDRPTDISDEAVEAFINRMLLAQLVVITDDGRLTVDGESFTRMVVAETQETIGRSTVLTVDDEINSGLGQNVIKDEGNSEKTAWRWQLGSFASNAFGENIPTNSQVVLLPGASDVEYKLWQSLGFDLGKMVMVEGKKDKCEALKDLLSNGDATPQFVEAFLGEPKDRFPQALAEKTSGTKTAILSFDTEVVMKPELYNDVLAVLENLEIGEDLVMVLNVVAQRGHQTSTTKLEDFYEAKTGQPYTGEVHPRSVILEQMPQFLLADLRRSDLSLEASHTLTYTGFSATRMECLFVHFKRS